MDEMIKKLDAVLKALRIRYVIIGGIAASILGRPRTTLDADVVIVTSESNIEKLIEKLIRAGFKISEGSKQKIIERLKRLLPVKIRYGRHFSIDLRLASYSIDRKAIKRALSVYIFGIYLPIATSEDIIVYKIARFEDIDRADIKAILIRNKGKIDLKYIKRESNRLSSETGYTHINKNFKEVLSWIRAI